MTGSQLDIQVVVSRHFHTIILAGEMDMAGVPELAAIVSGICANGQRNVIIDLRKLTFLDSSGLHALLRAQQECRARDNELRIIPGPPNVQRLFELTGTSETLRFTEPADEDSRDSPSSDGTLPRIDT
jgi:anti-anti-sigma factor